MKVVVRTVLHESALEAVPNTRVKEIFNLISKSLGVQETWWFGLMYPGPDNEEIWIEQSKKVSSTVWNVNNSDPTSLRLLVSLGTVILLLIFFPLCTR